MTTLSFLIAFAIAGGQVTFAGAVATPTAASVPVVVHASKTATGQQERANRQVRRSSARGQHPAHG